MLDTLFIESVQAELTYPASPDKTRCSTDGHFAERCDDYPQAVCALSESIIVYMHL